MKKNKAISQPEVPVRSGSSIINKGVSKNRAILIAFHEGITLKEIRNVEKFKIHYLRRF